MGTGINRGDVGSDMKFPDLTGIINTFTNLAMFVTGVLTWFAQNIYITLALVVVLGGAYLYLRSRRNE
jgi:hypothetical protein